jgi:hypothetical protein
VGVSLAKAWHALCMPLQLAEDFSGETHMNISAISSATSASAVQRTAQSAAQSTQSAQSGSASNKPSNPSVKPHHQHHHAGGAKGTGALTSGTLTSSGSTPVLDTLV